MDSRGGVTGGATLTDFISAYARDGYRGSFAVRPGGRLFCASCKRTSDAGNVPLKAMRRVEGASDPDDMAAVAALECPACGARGTATFCVGTRCPPEDGLVLRALQDHRESSRQVLLGGDPSLVRDSGWLPGPPNG